MTNGKDQNNILKIGELPILRVVSNNRLIFHEEPDKGRLLRLVDRLGGEGILKNPPIVAAVEGGDSLIILDGANRATALTKLGFKHFPVQVINFDDPLFKLHCWNHVIERLSKEYFLEKLSKIEGARSVELPGSPDELPQFGAIENGICHFMFNNGTAAFICGGRSISDKVRILADIADLYLNETNFDRVSYSNREHLTRHYPDFTALVTFRRIEKDEFLKLINTGLKLPAGITRVFLPKRALGLNIPLEFLKSELTLDEKNRWLDDMITRRVRDKAIRFYREPTFVFDE